jgi:hypothetical protein
VRQFLAVSYQLVEWSNAEDVPHAHCNSPARTAVAAATAEAAALSCMYILQLRNDACSVIENVCQQRLKPSAEACSSVIAARFVDDMSSAVPLQQRAESEPLVWAQLDRKLYLERYN